MNAFWKLRPIHSVLRKKKGDTIKKFFTVFLTLAMLVAILTGCSGSSGGFSGGGSDAGGGSQDGGAASSGVKVVAILGAGGLGDQSFNDLIYEGLMRAKNELGVDFDYVEPKQITEFEALMTTMSSTGDYAVILCIGFDQQDALAKVAP